MAKMILKPTKFDTEKAPKQCVTFRSQLEQTQVLVINTPDLMQPNISEVSLNEHITECVRQSAPGPHVFLLLLQHDDFTEENRLKLCEILELFSVESFCHSLILISSPRVGSDIKEDDEPNQSLKDMIRKCRYRYLKLKNLEVPELLTRIGQIAKENNGHVTCGVSGGSAPGLTGEEESLDQSEGVSLKSDPPIDDGK